MTILLFTAAALIVYVYVGYPLLIRVIVRLVGRKDIARKEIEPTVTLLISAYNEEAVIRTKLVNSLALDYPKDKLQIVVISDCSTDRTDDIVREFEAQGVRLQRMPQRRGKTWGLNEAVPRASGDVLVFSDANALYRTEAIRKLVRNFNDPQVGCVAGESRYLEAGRSSVGEQESLYWNYERQLKLYETWLGSMVGSDGAIFAIRKNGYQPLEEGEINDFVLPLYMVIKGFRCVYEPEAICDEKGTTRYHEEFRRKVRIVNRSIYGLHNTKVLLNPFRHGWFAIQLWSHKLLRWAIPIFLGVAFASNLFLTGEGILYRALFALQMAFYLSACLGAGVAKFRIPAASLLTLPYYFCLMNIAAAIGLGKGLTGHVQVTWTPERDDGAQPSTICSNPSATGPTSMGSSDRLKNTVTTTKKP